MIETLDQLKERILRESERAIHLLRDCGLYGRWSCNTTNQTR